MEAFLTPELVHAVGAVLAVLVLIVGAGLAKLAREKLGVDVDTSRLNAVATAAEQGVLLAAQTHKAAKEAADAVGDPVKKAAVNQAMHQTAVTHVMSTVGKAAERAGGAAVVNAAVHAAVRKLKGLL